MVNVVENFRSNDKKVQLYEHNDMSSKHTRRQPPIYHDHLPPPPPRCSVHSSFFTEPTWFPGSGGLMTKKESRDRIRPLLVRSHSGKSDRRRAPAALRNEATPSTAAAPAAGVVTVDESAGPQEEDDDVSRSSRRERKNGSLRASAEGARSVSCALEQRRDAVLGMRASLPRRRDSRDTERAFPAVSLLR